MSEFRQAIAHVEALEARLTDLQDALTRDSISDSVVSSFSFILSAIYGQADATMDKFRARVSMIDPVTKQPWFGPKMVAKVHELLRRYDDVKLAVHEDAPLRLYVETKLRERNEQQEAQEALKRARETQVQEAQQATEREKKRLEMEAREREAERREQEDEQTRALAAAAQMKRAKRAAAERQRQEEAKEQARVTLSKFQGKEGLERAIGRLRESTGSEAQFRQSLQQLLTVVTTLCNSPENAAYRRIPKQNVHFHADLGRFDGGYQCLLALGFQEVRAGDEDDPTIAFVLEEPEVSEDLDAWSTWFDGLKDMQRLVEAFLS